MVRRAVSLRRGSALELEIDTAVNNTGGSLNSGGGMARRGSRRESLPLSRHHQMRRSSSVSTRTRTNSSSTSSLSSLGDSDGSMRGSSLDDELAIIIDDDDEFESGAQIRPGRRKQGVRDNRDTRVEKEDGKMRENVSTGAQEKVETKAEV